MDNKEFKIRLLELLRTNNLKGAFELIFEILPIENPIYQESILQSAEFNRIQEAHRMNLIDYEVMSRQLNKVIFSLLQLTDSIEEFLINDKKKEVNIAQVITSLPIDKVPIQLVEKGAKNVYLLNDLVNDIRGVNTYFYSLNNVIYFASMAQEGGEISKEYLKMKNIPSKIDATKNRKPEKTLMKNKHLRKKK